MVHHALYMLQMRIELRVEFNERLVIMINKLIFSSSKFFLS